MLSDDFTKVLRNSSYYLGPPRRLIIQLVVDLPYLVKNLG